MLSPETGERAAVRPGEGVAASDSHDVNQAERPPAFLDGRLQRRLGILDTCFGLACGKAETNARKAAFTVAESGKYLISSGSITTKLAP